jgi:hypothetical protein
MFENSHTRAIDEQSGHPSTYTIEENIEQVHAMILDN